MEEARKVAWAQAVRDWPWSVVRRKSGPNEVLWVEERQDQVCVRKDALAVRGSALLSQYT